MATTKTGGSMLYEIKHRLNGSILFSLETTSLKLCVETAVTSGADLRGAYLGGADLRGAYLRDADLGGADLGGADLRGAYLRDADLRGAYLGGADLRGAYLRGAYLGGADLRGAYLRDADLRGAYLGGADLRGAYLRDADLRDADLGGADLGGVKDVICAGQPNGYWFCGWHKDGVLMIRGGCHSVTITKAREYWTGKPDRLEVIAALDCIERIAELRGWPLRKAEAA